MKLWRKLNWPLFSLDTVSIHDYAFIKQEAKQPQRNSMPLDFHTENFYKYMYMTRSMIWNLVQE